VVCPILISLSEAPGPYFGAAIATLKHVAAMMVASTGAQILWVMASSSIRLLVVVTMVVFTTIVNEPLAGPLVNSPAAPYPAPGDAAFGKRTKARCTIPGLGSAFQPGKNSEQK
jgi:hypothetical protein